MKLPFNRATVGTDILFVVLCIVYFGFDTPDSSSPLALHGSLGDIAAAPWQLLTYSLTHTGLIHLIVNLIVLVVGGSLLEKSTSTLRMLIVYIAGALAGAVVFAATCAAVGVDDATLSGSSAAVLAVCAAWLGQLPEATTMIKSNSRIRLAVIVVLLIAVAGITGDNPGGSLAHLGGIVTGWLLGRHFALSDKSDLSDRSDPSDKASSQASDILAKAERSGFASLSADERRRLFKSSNPSRNGSKQQ